MYATAERLLRESIEQHRERRESKDIAARGWHCPLCKEYQAPVQSPTHCGACPIRAQTKKHCCRGTPYEAMLEAYYAWQREGGKDAWRAYQNAEDVEIAFLESLLPGK